ncbi:DUF3017 domain-containing protein [Streptomyces gobiensis]|uniref:DUF3017 domain-containing protein n=1 Tax=Streptomyces gobiensis TaxID=2875706 RepID=UPI001E2BFABA|nr:DUF3017 domain-containing protein [Streptomyces gobiensis]UGY93221.1 DUF3017 domain-containing protein [Streptomyces gobiensis]
MGTDSTGAPRGRKSGAAGVNGANGVNGVNGAAAPDASAPRKGSRRFPSLTRDTARPEGGERAAAGHAPAPYRQWPLLTVLAGAAAGLLVTLVEARIGALVIGAALLTGAVLRWLLPSVGMLAVRSRFTDVLTYGALGTGIVLLALMAPPEPWLTIPFLEDIVGFSVR